MIALAAILSTWTPQAAREQHKAAPIHTRPQGRGADPHKATRPTPAIHTGPAVAGGCFECGEPVDHAGPPVRDGRMVACFECGLCYCGAPAVYLEPLPRCLDHAAGADFDDDDGGRP